MTDLDHVDSLDLLRALDQRYWVASAYVERTAKQYPLDQRRTIVEHIKEAMTQAKTEHHLMDPAQTLRNHLIHDFWSDFKVNSAATREHKRLLEDFSVIAVMNPSARQKDLHGLLQRLVPEDAPNPVHPISTNGR
ncbi:MAG: hypothetical protein II938_04950 [Alphaproteobacteria bacterium]|nr:hypothetical protein [Alphaproteobacteria bacterium]